MFFTIVTIIIISFVFSVTFVGGYPNEFIRIEKDAIALDQAVIMISNVRRSKNASRGGVGVAIKEIVMRMMVMMRMMRVKVMMRMRMMVMTMVTMVVMMVTTE